MASVEGNVIQVPGQYVGESYLPIEIMQSMVGLYQKGRTIKGGQGLLKAGTFLDRDGAGKAVKSATGALAFGVLRLSVDTGADPLKDKLGPVVLGGILKRAPLVAAQTEGIVAAAVTALGGHSDIANPADPNSYTVKF